MLIELEPTKEFYKECVAMRRGVNSRYVTKPEKKSGIPFKKGSSKFKMCKKLKNTKTRNTTVKFHDKRMKNFSIASADQYIEGEAFTTSISADGMSLLDTYRNKETSIMINCGDNIFRRLTRKSYFKLCKLRRVMITSSCVVRDDTDDETVLHKDTRVIETINSLLRILTEERIRCDCIYETQIKYCGFSLYDFKYKIMSLDKNGKYHYYSDINKFCKEYRLDLI